MRPRLSLRLPRRIAGWLAFVLLSLSACDDPRSQEPSDLPESSSVEQRPNILLIVIDTARADHFSSYGYVHKTTPHIDRLARESVMFRNAHSVAPWTLPAHMSMFTGLPPGRHGATWRAYSEPPHMSLVQLLSKSFAMKTPERALATRLKNAGYQTMAFTSNPWVGGRTGMAAGFESFEEVWRRKYTLPDFIDQFRETLKINPVLDKTMTGTSLVLFKNRIESRETDNPFFAFFNFTDPHYPYAPPMPFRFRFGGDRDFHRRAIQGTGALEETALVAGKPIAFEKLVPFYDAELSFVDFMIGNLTDWLRDRNLYRNALIIITADHGEHLGEQGRFSHNLSVQEELLRIPLIIKFPHGARAGTVVDSPLVSNIDVYQTILSAAGVAGPGRASRESMDLARMRSFDRKQLLAEYYFSDAFLNGLKQAYPPFDPTPHRLVRRALYTDSLKVVFENLAVAATLPLSPYGGGGNPMLTPEEALSALSDYVHTLSQENTIEEQARDVDAEMLQRLRALGYVAESSSQAETKSEKE